MNWLIDLLFVLPLAAAWASVCCWLGEVML